MSKLQNDEPVQVSGKQIEKILGALIGTLIGFLLVRWLVVPSITWWQFLLTEFIIMSLYTLGNLLLKKK